MIRTLWAILVTAAATLGLGSVAIVASLLGARGALYSRLTRAWARAALRASATPVVAHGMERVDFTEPCVVASNHVSNFDILAVAGVMPGRFAFIAKKELERIPVFGAAWKAAGHISIDRSNREKAIRSLERAAEVMLRDRSAVIIYPEGTRSRTGELMPFKKGAFVLALNAGVPIVPLVVRGSERIQRPGSLRIHPHPIHLHFCPPIDPRAYGEERIDALAGDVRAAMLAVLSAPAAPAARG